MNGIIKETTGTYCAIRTNTYMHTLAHFENLYQAALVDFPTLKRGDVEVVQYGGQRHKHMFGIEFKAPDGATVPDGYKSISQLEPTL